MNSAQVGVVHEMHLQQLLRWRYVMICEQQQRLSACEAMQWHGARLRSPQQQLHAALLSAGSCRCVEGYSAQALTSMSSDASCNASSASDVNRNGSVVNSVAISLTTRWNGNTLISRSVVRCSFRISMRARVPGRNLLHVMATALQECEKKGYGMQRQAG
jgi:hypothetical protein